MTSAIFSDWLINFDREIGTSNRKIALILDNTPSHYITASLLNIELIFIPPNMTFHLQPLDAGIIHSFKANYRKKLI